MELGIAFALGLLGSMHCVAMCGPLMLALPVLSSSRSGFIAQRLLYQLGRIATYCLLGLVAGLIGKSLFLLGAQQWLSIALGVCILIGFFASGRIFAFTFAVRLVNRLRGLMSAQLQRHSLRSLVLLGMLNGLLPCGLVYVAMAGAISEGAVLKSVSYMAMFGLGTSPTTLGISLSRKLFPATIRLKLHRAIPIGVCLLAGLLIVRGLALGIPYVSPSLGTTGNSCCSTTH